MVRDEPVNGVLPVNVTRHVVDCLSFVYLFCHLQAWASLGAVPTFTEALSHVQIVLGFPPLIGLHWLSIFVPEMFIFKKNDLE